MRVLVTGGTGFIGSHTVVELIGMGYEVTVIDNLVNSDVSVLKNIKKITGRDIYFKKIDIRNTLEVKKVIHDRDITAVIHFAALKAVGESTEKPLYYYQNNIGGLMSLLEAMDESGVHDIIFSSSATVYGDPESVPIKETDPLGTTTNPYGETKQMSERIIADVARVSRLSSIILRYFNPIGAHPSGLIGEEPRGIPNNLVPYITQVAAGKRKELTIFGDDYPTNDGSGVRDYIHVVDLAKAHVEALNYLDSANEDHMVTAFNIGTGCGVSVLELISTFEKVNKVKVPSKIGSRRAGDIAECYASAEKAQKILGWMPELSLENALEDAWRWQKGIN